jgi:hypothetical protein
LLNKTAALPLMALQLTSGRLLASDELFFRIVIAKRVRATNRVWKEVSMDAAMWMQLLF